MDCSQESTSEVFISTSCVVLMALRVRVCMHVGGRVYSVAGVRAWLQQLKATTCITCIHMDLYVHIHVSVIGTVEGVTD